MKQIIIKGAVILCSIGLIISFNSCKKSELDEQTTTVDNGTAKTITTVDNGTAETMFSDVHSVVDDAAQSTSEVSKTAAPSSLGICANISIDTIVFPITLTIDFGTGCTGTDGITRSGKIIAVFTGMYRDTGTKITVTLQNYYVNDYKIEGNEIITNNGRNVSNNLTYTVNVTNAKVTAPSGDIITWVSTRIHEWIAGENTILNICDDVYSVTGSANGTNREGRNFTVTIISPLIKNLCCRWIIGGTLEIQPEGLAKRTIDYGDGATCNGNINIKINQEEYNITLP